MRLPSPFPWFLNLTREEALARRLGVRNALQVSLGSLNDTRKFDDQGVLRLILARLGFSTFSNWRWGSV